MLLLEAEFDKLVDQGILTPVQHAHWAASIVSIMKADQKQREFVRILRKQSMTLNKYSIPKIEDLFVRLVGGQKLTKLDISLSG